MEISNRQRFSLFLTVLFVEHVRRSICHVALGSMNDSQIEAAVQDYTSTL